MARLLSLNDRPSTRGDVEWQDGSNSDLENSCRGTANGAEAECRRRRSQTKMSVLSFERTSLYFVQQLGRH